MSRIYDQQYRNRVKRCLLFCPDPIASEIIADLAYFIDHPELRDHTQARDIEDELMSNVVYYPKSMKPPHFETEPDVALDPVSTWLD